VSNDERRSEIVRYWWLKSEESLRSASREFEAESYSFAVNRLYYALFYGVCAALLDRGLRFRKHSGVRSAFHREFIGSGELEVQWGKLYDQLFEDRQEGDYVALVEFDKEYIRKQLERCCQFLEALRPLISSILSRH
jgi:uncharacterized protein (UPF0332 family)